MRVKKFVLGQYFTKRDIVKRVLDLVQTYKKYPKTISILEPSSGTRNFVKELEEDGFKNIVECELDKELTDTPQDFLLFDLKKKFDLVIGNPPFTKYNLKESYYFPRKYLMGKVNPLKYLPKKLAKKEKTQIENAFILKSIEHLKDKNSSLAFVLPISFFIANKNKDVKEIIKDKFSTIIIYQNDKNWFEEPIPCCFAIFTNIEEYKDRIILLYEDGQTVHEILKKDELLKQELIPKSFLYKKRNGNKKGHELKEFLSEKRVKYQKDYKKNNVSASNILKRTKIPSNENIEDYALAVARVGNSSVGKSGLINLKKDILNDMFYVFEFKEHNKELKEKIIEEINNNQDHFKNCTVRVGSKSIKKNDVLEFRVKIK